MNNPIEELLEIEITSGICSICWLETDKRIVETIVSKKFPGFQCQNTIKIANRDYGEDAHREYLVCLIALRRTVVKIGEVSLCYKHLTQLKDRLDRGD